MKRLIIAILILFLCFDIAGATTLSDARTRVREMLYETDSTNSIYSDTLLNEAIKEAQFMVLESLPFSANYNMLTTAAVTLINGQATYSLPADFWAYVSCSYKGTPAIQIRPEEYYGKVRQATIKDPLFCIIASKLVLLPTPTTGDTMEIQYVKTPTDLATDTTSISLLAEYDRLIAVGATWYILNLDNQATRAATTEKLFIALIQKKIDMLRNSNIVEKVTNAK